MSDICILCKGSQNVIRSFNPLVFEVCGFCGGRGVTHHFHNHSIIRCRGFNVASSSGSVDSNVFNKSELVSSGKGLMAHVMVDMGIFKSVGEAKRNGWDKPLEIGDFCVTKRKICFSIIDN